MHIYFSGVGGVAIGPLSIMATQLGHNVSGSDRERSRLSDIVAKKGVYVSYGQTMDAIQETHKKQPIDWFVYTASLPLDHPELTYCRSQGIKTSKRDEFVNHVIADKKLKMIAVSGTHGKTTTTAMAVWCFKQLNIPVSYMIGSNISFGESAEYAEGSEWFVYEADEFDRNMLRFNPEIAVIPSLDYDHPDTYPSQAEYDEAFAQFSRQSSLTIDSIDESLHFRIAGEHNRSNANMVVQAVSKALDLETVELIDALNSFPGSERRFEKLADNLYTDYGHHPVELAATIQMASELSDNVVAVYQPHQNIRQHEILSEGGYGVSLKEAKITYWLPTYLSREDPALEVLTPAQLIESLDDSSSVATAEMNDELIAKIKQHLADGALVLCMSAGSLDGWLRESFTKPA